MCLIEQQNFPDLIFALCYTKTGDLSKQILTVTQKEVHKHPPFGFTSRVHLAITGNDYTLNVMGYHLQSGLLQGEAEVHELCQMMSSQSPYKFFPGFDSQYYEEHYQDVIRFPVKSVRYSMVPFVQINSLNCKLWFKIPVNPPLADRFKK